MNKLKFCFYIGKNISHCLFKKEKQFENKYRDHFTLRNLTTATKKVK